MDTGKEGMYHSRYANRIMAEMAALAASMQDYGDVVHAVLDLVEDIVASPFLSLAILERGQVGHYPRIDGDVDQDWADDVTRYVADLHTRRLTAAGESSLQKLSGPVAWIATFPAETRSGRGGALTLACPAPIELQEDEEELMFRLARQALLVLDHVLLIGEIENLETVDPLSGAASHRQLVEMLEYEFRRHRYFGKGLALLMIDVEGLDGINRSFGRQYGNHILKKVAGLLQETVRPIDLVARSGLDEFAVILPEADDGEAGRIVDLLRDRMLAVGFAGGSIGLSIAMVHARPDDSLSAEGFLRRGEQILQETKRQEREWNTLWGRGQRAVT